MCMLIWQPFKGIYDKKKIRLVERGWIIKGFIGNAEEIRFFLCVMKRS